MLTWNEAPRCLRYKPDGQLCGAPATGVDPEAGISVCTAHVHAAPGWRFHDWKGPAPERHPRIVKQGELPVAATLDCGCHLSAGALALEVESKSADVVWRESACRRHAAIIGAVDLLRTEAGR